MKVSKLNTDFKQLLNDIAQKHGANSQLLEELINFERTKVHLDKRRGAKEKIREMIENFESNSP